MHPKPVTRRPDPAIGDPFGRLTVIGPIFRRPSASSGKAVKWLTVRCECGTEKAISLANLRAARSCGCGQREAAAESLRKTSTIHGDTGTKLHRIWVSMKNRCRDPRPAVARHYRDRGITVCPEWETSYEAFRAWALANDYAPGLTLDRIDGSMGYGPTNCRWATMKQQQNNRRDNLSATAWGETKVVTEWAADRRCVVNYNALRYRIRKGWEPERAITTPTTVERISKN